jgi:hypothetical protein
MHRGRRPRGSWPVFVIFILFSISELSLVLTLQGPVVPFLETIPKRHPHIYIAIFSARMTKNRLTRMFERLLNPTFFRTDRVVARVIVPKGHGFTEPVVPLLISECPSSIQAGLCCRTRVAMDDFLDRDIDYFVRAIDDSWFNLENLESYIEQLDSLLDPRIHVITKGHLSLWHARVWNVSIVQGGSPILMSQAAVRHISRYFPEVCEATPFGTDDNAFSFVLQKIFSSREFWADVRFCGSPLRRTNLTPAFSLDWDQNHATDFRYFNQSCRVGKEYPKPWRTMVGAHTSGGVPQWQEAIELAHTTSIPENLMVEWRQTEGYRLCLGPIEVKRELTSLGYVDAHTPRLRLTDPRLNYSIRDIVELSLRECPRWGPANCEGLRKRWQSINATD